MPSGRSRAFGHLLLALGMVAFLSPPAHADAICPNVLIIWPAAWVLLLAIIPIEAAVALRMLRITFRQALKMSAAANAVSTLGGIPANWILLVLLMLVLSAFGACEGPFTALGRATFMASGKSAGYSGVFWATALFFGPLFLLSVFWEYRIARRYFDKERWPEVRRWAWTANAVSYGVILVVLLYEVARALSSGGEFWI